MNKIFSIQEVADILGVSTKTLRRWEEKGIFIPHRTPGNQRRYTQDQVDDFRRQRSGLPKNLSSQVSFRTPGEILSDSPHQKEAERLLGNSENSQYWMAELAKSILAFKKLAVSAVFVMLFIAVAAVTIAALKSANFLDANTLPKILSFAGGNKRSVPQPQLSEVLRTGKAVLGAGTQGGNLIFGVNVQSEFADSAQFLSTIKVAGIATLSGGVITENQDVNAGTGKLTASNVLYGAIGGTGITVGPGQTPTITNTGVLSLTAGSGISVGTGTKPTISNTGVLSLGGSTGDLTLKAGTGISVSGLTITNNDLGSSQNIFKTIAVTGASSFSAGSNTDTLTFTSGTGITLSSDTTNKKVTITAASNALLWQENSGALVPSNITDDLLLGGTASSTAKFAFLNNAGGTPAASVSATSAGTGISIGGDGIIQSFRNASLIVGGNTTGNITLSPLNGSGILNLSLASTNGLTVNGITGSTLAGTAQCVTTTNGIVTGSGTCQLGTEQWVAENGTLHPGTLTFDLLVGGNSTASAKFGLLNNAGGTPTASISANSGNNAIYITGNGTLATTNRQTLTIGNSAAYNTTGNVLINPNGTGNVGIGTTSPGATLDVSGNATVSGNLTLYGGARSIQTTSNNNLTIGGASTGNITISPQNGSGTLALSLGALTVNSNTGASVAALSCVSTTNGIVTGTGACTVGSGGSVWTLNTTTGTLYPINNSVDLLIGGTATSSAKFAVLNVSTSTPTASISATAAGTGLTLGGDGTIQSLRNNTLTIGGSTTGNIVLSPNNGTGGLTTNNGNFNLSTGNAYQIAGTSVLNATTLGAGVTGSSLTSVGTITTGIWNATRIGSQYGGTGIDTSASTGVPVISSGTWSIDSNA
ncbi:MAG: MerR family transcriptional regulator, partial [Patescibacteria group bacterium]|nr:MerR family transcriptional regulator [Patescibacteria group bacterium]